MIAFHSILSSAAFVLGTVCWCLRMTVRTKNFQVAGIIILVIAIFMVHLKDDRLPVPLDYTTFFTFVTAFFKNMLPERSSCESSCCSFGRRLIDMLTFCRAVFLIRSICVAAQTEVFVSDCWFLVRTLVPTQCSRVGESSRTV